MGADTSHDPFPNRTLSHVQIAAIESLRGRTNRPAQGVGLRGVVVAISRDDVADVRCDPPPRRRTTLAAVVRMVLGMLLMERMLWTVDVGPLTPEMVVAMMVVTMVAVLVLVTVMPIAVMHVL